MVEEKISKMRLKNAVQAMSGTMASVIQTFATSKCKYLRNKERINN